MGDLLVIGPRALQAARTSRGAASPSGGGATPSGSPLLNAPVVLRPDSPEISQAARDRIAQRLIAQYRDLSWSRPDEKRQLLAVLLATGSPAVAPALAREFQDLSWSQPDAKRAVLDALVGTRSDAAADAILREEEDTSWSQAAPKKALLEALRQLATPLPQPPCAPKVPSPATGSR